MILWLEENISPTFVSLWDLSPSALGKVVYWQSRNYENSSEYWESSTKMQELLWKGCLRSHTCIRRPDPSLRKTVFQVSAVTETLSQNETHWSKLSNDIKHGRTHTTHVFLKIELEWYLKSSMLIISKRYALFQSRNRQCTMWPVCSTKALLILNEWNKEMLEWKTS